MPGVEVLGVLAHDHEVDARVPDRDAGERASRAHRAEQVEPLTQGDVHAPEPTAHRRGDRPLERDPARPDRVERGLGQQLAVLVERGGAGVPLGPFDPDVGGVEHEPDGLGHLGADAVAGDQGHAVGHRAERYRTPAARPGP